MKKLKVSHKKLDKSVKRIAQHINPVELVNNMYGCHPSGPDISSPDYFSQIYGKL